MAIRAICVSVSKSVLSDGQIWNGLRGLRKDNTGYALKHLFIGGEGTLGIVTAAVMKLFPRSREIETAFLGLNRVEDVMALFARAREASGDQLTAFELIPRIGLDIAVKHIAGVVDPLPAAFPWYVLMEMSSSQRGSGLRTTMENFLADMAEAGLIADGTIATSAAQARGLWRIREGLVEAQKFEGGSIKHDVSVPVSQVATFITRALAAVTEHACRASARSPSAMSATATSISICASRSARTPRNFSAGGKNSSRVVHDIVAEMRGSISAEHGIGRLKREELAHYAAPLELTLMKKIKAALDPKSRT